jgi:DNA-directed RNA polymerase subunit RPC12/RpoP
MSNYKCPICGGDLQLSANWTPTRVYKCAGCDARIDGAIVRYIARLKGELREMDEAVVENCEAYNMDGMCICVFCDTDDKHETECLTRRSRARLEAGDE